MFYLKGECMRGNSILKAGKLIKITLDYEDGKIDNIKIYGDFFMHPEEGISKIEQGLVGCVLKKEELEGKVSEILNSENIQVFGFDSNQLSEAILMALGGEKA